MTKMTSPVLNNSTLIPIPTPPTDLPPHAHPCLACLLVDLWAILMLLEHRHYPSPLSRRWSMSQQRWQSNVALSLLPHPPLHCHPCWSPCLPVGLFLMQLIMPRCSYPHPISTSTSTQWHFEQTHTADAYVIHAHSSFFKHMSRQGFLVRAICLGGQGWEEWIQRRRGDKGRERHKGA